MRCRPVNLDKECIEGRKHLLVLSYYVCSGEPQGRPYPSFMMPATKQGIPMEGWDCWMPAGPDWLLCAPPPLEARSLLPASAAHEEQAFQAG